MKINLGSLYFNMDLCAPGGTPAWGTELGQGKDYKLGFDGMEDLLPSMLYCSIADSNESVDCPLGRSRESRKNYEYVIASKFSKIYVNNTLVRDASFVLLIVRLIRGQNHVGRMTLKYNPKITYQNVTNEDCFNKIQAKLGLSDQSAWFISEISTRNQDELHFTAHIVDRNNSQTYDNTESRKAIFQSFLNQQLDITSSRQEGNKYSLQEIYFGAPGSGKSHRVSKELDNIDEARIFRTTFHPDSDYASFVGCYKPDIKSELAWEEHYNFDELLEIIPTDIPTGEPYAVEKFCLRHYRAIDQLNLSRGERDQLRRRILDASRGTEYQGDTIQTATVDVGIHLGKYLEEQGILSRTGRNSEITYSFTPQVFTNAYVRAWQEPYKDIYLVIEEINRGNCAQIFGDLFQLLDRDEGGVSCYKIKADKDLAGYLEETLGKDHEGIKGGNLRLPANLHIIATMNTSDQSLFPMDSAFKRRWDWVYVPISYNEDKSSTFEISIGDKKYLWVKFLEEVNAKILEATQSEDKQMGNFFIKRSIVEDEFKSKVMFYLWHEVCKDEYHTKNNFFRYTTEDGEKEFSFNDLHTEKGSTILQGFMAYLGISPINGDSEPTEGANEQPS
jgi:type II restriction-modification system restriction subunit